MSVFKDTKSKVLELLLSGKFGDAAGMTSQDFHIYIGTHEQKICGIGKDMSGPSRAIARTFNDKLSETSQNLYWDSDTEVFVGTETKFKEALESF